MKARWLTIAGLALAGCQGSQTPAGPTPVAVETAPAAAAPAVSVPAQIAIASSDLAIGPQRFAFAILDPSGNLIPDADATIVFFNLADAEAKPVATGRAAFYPASLAPAGLYVVNTDFDAAGPWGAQITARLKDGGQIAPQRVRFEVAAKSQSPGAGDAPPETANRTLATEPDLAKLSSDPRPDAGFYRQTVDEAAKSGKPTVIVFATPAYCASRICGPVLDEVKQVKARFADRVNFIHIEVYKTFDPLVYADEMATWGLDTEPWVFVLGKDGRIADRLEGSVTAAELTPILERLTGS